MLKPGRKEESRSPHACLHKIYCLSISNPRRKEPGAPTFCFGFWLAGPLLTLSFRPSCTVGVCPKIHPGSGSYVIGAVGCITWAQRYGGGWLIQLMSAAESTTIPENLSCQTELRKLRYWRDPKKVLQMPWREEGRLWETDTLKDGQCP